MANSFITIYETKSFTKAIRLLISDSDRSKLFLHLKDNPKSGAVIRGTGGVRKIRWQAEHRGKSGGIRVVYYYYDKKNVLLLLATYSKNKKEDLSAKEQKQLSNLTKELMMSF